MRIAVPDLISNSYFPAVAAVELGFFKAEGLDAELSLVYPVPRCMEALRDGELDFVAGSAHATLQAFEDWKGAKLLAALAQRTYWLLIMRADLNIARGDLQAVKGKRIGAAPGPDLTFRRLLVEAGLDPERDNIEVGLVPGASAPGVSFGVHAAQALKEGVIDGFWANAMASEVAVRNGVGTVVLDVRRGDGPPASHHYTFPALVTKDSTIERGARDRFRCGSCHRQSTERTQGKPAPCHRGRGATLPRSRGSPHRRTWLRETCPTTTRRSPPEVVDNMNAFARDIGLLSTHVFYNQVVPGLVRTLWTQ